MPPQATSILKPKVLGDYGGVLNVPRWPTTANRRFVADVFESAAVPDDEVTHVPGGAGVGVFVVSAMPLWPLGHVEVG